MQHNPSGESPMPSLMIVTRQAKDGPRYVVRYRLGGRAWPVIHGGSFKTQREAKARRDFIAGEISAGRNPAVALRALLERPAVTTIVTVDEWAEKFLASRLDIDATTKRNYGTALKKVGKTFGDEIRTRSRWTMSPAGSLCSPRLTRRARSSST